MGLFSFLYKVKETIYLPVKPLPWPVMENDIWLITGPKSHLDLFIRGYRENEVHKKGYILRSYLQLFLKVNAERLRYNFPGLDIDNNTISSSSFNQAVCDALGIEIDESSGYLIRKVHGANSFYVAKITTTNRKTFYKVWEEYCKALPLFVRDSNVLFSKISHIDELEGTIRFRMAEHIEDENTPEVDNGTDEDHDDIDTLAAEVESKIEKLLMNDFPVEVIETWLQKAVKLSRVEVTADWRILLPDYGKEVKLRQLPKALFIFFLRHPEGCRLKELSDHREELLAIYRKLTISDDQAQVEASIDALVNAQGNSFSEKCAAVKLAFLKEIPERIAKNYYIQGPQGGVKGISLDRKMVEWEAEL